MIVAESATVKTSIGEVYGRISEYRPNLSRIFDSLISRLKPDHELPRDLGTLTHTAIRQHVIDCLGAIRYDETTVPIFLGKPTPTSPNYDPRFFYTIENGIVKVYDNDVRSGSDDTPAQCCQFDYSASIDFVPLLLNIKTGRVLKKAGIRNILNRQKIKDKYWNGQLVGSVAPLWHKRQGFQAQLSLDQKLRRLEVLDALFGTNNYVFAYVVPRDVYRAVRSPHSNLRRFQKMDNLDIIPLPITSTEIRQQVSQECERRAIPFNR